MRFNPVDESIGFPTFRGSIRTHRSRGRIAAEVLDQYNTRISNQRLQLPVVIRRHGGRFRAVCID